MRLPIAGLLVILRELLSPLVGMPRDRLIAAAAARCGWSGFAVDLVVARLVDRRRLCAAGDGADSVISLATVRTRHG